MEGGLSDNEVHTLIQDTKGYIWIATGDGLDRYDGYGFRVFRHDPNDPTSLSGNFVKSICVDSQGRLWIAPFPHGLDLYDAATETFKHYRHLPGDVNSLISDSVTSLKRMADGDILIGTSDAGLDILDPVTGKFRHFAVRSSPVAPLNDRINSIFIDSRGQIWLSTVAGFDRFDPTGKTPIQHFTVAADGRGNFIRAIAEDAQHKLWLATHDGAYVYDPSASGPGQPPKLQRGPKIMTGAILSDVFVDSEQNVWFASQTSGLYMLHAGSDQVRHYAQVMGSSDTLASDTTETVFEDKAGILWIGTDSGVDLLDPNIVDVLSLKPRDIAGNRKWYSDRVTALLPYGGKLLLGSSGGVYQFDMASADDALKDQRNVFLSLDRTRYGPVLDIAELPGRGLILSTASGDLLNVDRRGHILRSWSLAQGRPLRAINRILLKSGHEAYLGTFGSGLAGFDLRTGKVRRISGTTVSELAPTDIVEDVLQVGPTRLWAGTFRGVFLVDMSTEHSSLVPMTPGNIEPVVQSLYEDKQHTLWIGTLDGLWRIKLDGEGKPVSSAEAMPQLRKTQVLAIEQDDLGRLWLATVNSLIRFDPVKGTMLTFGRDQDSPMSEYFSYGHTHTSNGWLWFSGGQGAMGFKPENLRPNLHSPEVVMNAVTTYREGKPVHVLLPNGQPLKLSYQDAISIFDVAAMDFGAPKANVYSYRLLGFQSAWTTPASPHLITFTNLNPGRYRFEVRAANSWGTWSTTPAALDIIVLPPWWRTWWAYTLYILLIIGSSIAYIYSLKRKIKREEAISASLREANEIKSNFVDRLETQVKEATQELRETLQGVNLKNAELEVAHKRATEGEQIKSQFLANMSHELRTPLTGVLGYTKLLTSTPLSSEQKDYVGTIHQSSETLLAIINDTLDLSRLEAGKLLIDEVDFDLLEVIESTLELLAPTAYQKRLELVRVIPPEIPLQLRGDPLRLRQVLTNLLSNAIKFTESGSVSIEVRVETQDERDLGLVFRVSDTGIGIPEGEVTQLFTAYARGRISTRHHVEGTGLGLAICKKLLDLMGGEIHVTSKVGRGTCFDFQLHFKLQKNAAPRSQLPSKLRVLLYDAHPLSSQAWRASLTRMGADVRVEEDLEAAAAIQADAAVISLSERDLSQLLELQNRLPPSLPATLVLAPRIDRQALRHLSETLYRRVLSKSAREKTVHLELQSLLRIALKQEGGTRTAAHRQSATPPADAPLVLVADDNRINRRLLVTMLNQAGFRTAEAATGLELLDLAARGVWHAALLDIHMPGLDGIETAARLRSIYGVSVPPIVAMSADVMPDMRNQAEQGIVDGFLMKPFNEQQLVDLLRQHIDRYNRRMRQKRLKL